MTSLARLGADSGGTLVERTNDSTLALDTALHRSACVYSLGFRDGGPADGRRASFAVRLRKKGARAVHAAYYANRTEAMKRESLVRAAYFSPRSFDTSAVHATLVPIGLASAGTWSAEIAVSARAHGAAAPVRSAELGAVLSRGSTVVHRFARAIGVGGARPDDPDPDAATLVEPITLPPGKYVISAVLSDPAATLPESAEAVVELPEVPRHRAFLVGPILGRRDDRYEPLVGARLDAPTNLVVVTQVCAVEADAGLAPQVVARTVRSASGSVIGTLEPVRVTLDGPGPARCASLVDVVPAAAMSAGGEYVFEARLGDEPSASTVQARFSVAPGSEVTPAVVAGNGP